MTRRWLRKRGSRLDRLSQDDVEVVRQCLTAAVRGPFFDDDDEFHTLFGLERSEVENVLRGWPDPENPKDQDLAVTNTLNNLLGYPHRQWDVWHEFIIVPPRDVASVLARWLGKDELDTSGRGYFERLR